MSLSRRTIRHPIVIFGFALATAAGCSLHVLPGVGSSESGGGGGSPSSSGDMGGAPGAGSGAGAGVGAGDADSCTATCDCQTFCSTAAPCYAMNFSVPECLQDCETNIPGDLRQYVCDAKDCDEVHGAEDNTWYGKGSCAPWTGSGDSLDACLSCWNIAATGACFPTERAYEADSSALALDACVGDCHYSWSCINDCRNKHVDGVVDWDSAAMCAVCGPCEYACAGTALSSFVCGPG